MGAVSQHSSVAWDLLPVPAPTLGNVMRTYFKKTRKKYVDPLRGVGGNRHMKALRKRFKEVAAARGGVDPKNAWLMGL